MTNQYLQKTFDVTAVNIPLQVTEFTPRAGDYSVNPFARIQFGQFYMPHEELMIKPFQEHMIKLGELKDIKVVKLDLPICDKESSPENDIRFRVDLPFGPIVSLFINLRNAYAHSDLYTTTEQQKYLESHRIYANAYNLTVTGTPLLQTNINNSNLYYVPIYNTRLLIPEFSEFRNEKSKEYNAETFIKKHYNNGCHKPLHEAFEYITHYIKRVTQK